MVRDKDKHKKTKHAWYLRNRERIIENQRLKRMEVRKEVISILGGRCVYCRCDLFEVLEVNHKFGKGMDDRRKNTRRGIYKQILSGEREGEFEVTCKICNAWHYLKKILRVPGNWTILWSRD